MNDESLTYVFTVDQTPETVFAAINDVRHWWTGQIDGPTDKLGAEFTYSYQDLHRSTQRVTELSPGLKVVWHVSDSYLNFAGDKTEWTGTEIMFDIRRKGAQTEVRFTHVGLIPDFECFDSCSDAWGFYINSSLRDLITTGKGHPNESDNESKTA
jgi:hypothetical protein